MVHLCQVLLGGGIRWCIGGFRGSVVRQPEALREDVSGRWPGRVPWSQGSHTVVEAEGLKKQTLCVWMSFWRTWAWWAWGTAYALAGPCRQLHPGAGWAGSEQTQASLLQSMKYGGALQDHGGRGVCALGLQGFPGDWSPKSSPSCSSSCSGSQWPLGKQIPRSPPCPGRSSEQHPTHQLSAALQSDNLPGCWLPRIAAPPHQPRAGDQPLGSGLPEGAQQMGEVYLLKFYIAPEMVLYT